MISKADEFAKHRSGPAPRAIALLIIGNSMARQRLTTSGCPKPRSACRLRLEAAPARDTHGRQREGQCDDGEDPIPAGDCCDRRRCAAGCRADAAERAADTAVCGPHWRA